MLIVSGDCRGTFDHRMGCRACACQWRLLRLLPQLGFSCSGLMRMKGA